MNGESEKLVLIRSVLGLGNGESHAVRECHARGTIHRYRDGWHFYFDANDHVAMARALVGYTFVDEQDMADFLLNELGPSPRLVKIIGERLTDASFMKERV